MGEYRGILLVGPPGCGKGTQGKLLNQKDGYFHFSTGDMFRDLDNSTELGSKVKTLIDSGNFVDDATTIALAKETLQEYERNNVFDPNDYLVLDGLPRNIAQVSLVSEFVLESHILYFEVPRNKLIERIKSRAIKEGRADDANEERILKRLNTFDEITKPMLLEYPIFNIVNINANKPVEDVQNDILGILGKKN